MKYRERSAPEQEDLMVRSEDDALGGSSDVRQVAPASEAADTEARLRADPLAQRLVAGTVINSKYRVESFLGQGAMGVVVLCEHLELRERVALKFLRTTKYPGGDDFNARFLREAQVCAKLKNRHITRVVDVGIWGDDCAFMVMEYLDGLDLRQILQQTGRIPVARAVNYVVQLCEGLAEAHALGIVHRDLKPSNVVVVRDIDGSELVKILDFGISKLTSPDGQLLGAGEITETGLVLGSPKYMPPEQLFEVSAVGPHSDVWALGVMLYEMLLGRLPFDGRNVSHAIAWLSSNKPPASLCDELPDSTPELEAAIFRCLARDIGERTSGVNVLAGELLDAVGAPTAASVAERLSAILSGPLGEGPRTPNEGGTSQGAIRAAPPTRTFSTRKRKRARWWGVATAAAALCLAGGLGYSIARQHGAVPTPGPKGSAQARSIHVSIDATPPDARIQIDGADLDPGRSSFDVPPGDHDHVIRLSAPGYISEERQMPLTADVELKIVLERAPVAPPSATSTVALPSLGGPSLPFSKSATPSRSVPAKSNGPTPASSAKPSGCEAPYYFANGIKTFKPECL